MGGIAKRWTLTASAPRTRPVFELTKCRPLQDKHVTVSYVTVSSAECEGKNGCAVPAVISHTLLRSHRVTVPYLVTFTKPNSLRREAVLDLQLATA